MSTSMPDITAIRHCPALALELLAEHFREHAHEGFHVSAEESAALAHAFEGLALRTLFLEGIEATSRARVLAEKAVAIAIAEPDPVETEMATLEAIITDPKVVLFPTGGRRELRA